MSSTPKNTGPATTAKKRVPVSRANRGKLQLKLEELESRLTPSNSSVLLPAFYHDLLNRAPDAGAGGFGIQLDSGVPASKVALSIVTAGGNEYRYGLVQSYYARFLHRSGSLPEWQAYVNLLAAGATDEQVEAIFVGSVEYYLGHGGTSMGWLNGAFQDLLGRPNTEGSFLPEVNAGVSREWLALRAIMGSGEFCNGQVANYYQKFLGRSGWGDPGMANFANALQAGLVTDEIIIAQLLGSQEYYIKWASNSLNVSATGPASATANSPFSNVVSATGGSGTYTYAITAGSLPSWLTFNPSSRLLSGTPTTAGTSNFTITATDTTNTLVRGSEVFALTVNAASSLTLSPAALASATINSAYSATLSATGGSGTYTFAVTAGSLPSWLTLNAITGALTGTPTAAGSSNFSITATDSNNNALTGSNAYSLTVDPVSNLTVGPPMLPSAAANSAYSATVSAGGGSGSYTYSVSAGSLPSWLTLNASTGALSGTPTSSGSSSFTIKATDNNNTALTGTKSYALTVNAASSLTVSPATLASATANSAYSATASATGGSGTYTFSVSAGSLPSWLALNASTGALSGTPTTSGSASFTIKATDTSNAALTGTKAYTLTINAASILTVNPTTLANATANSTYSATVSATGGTGSYTFSVSAGSLPAWLTLNASTGALSGTPTTGGSASFTLKATDTANTARTGTKAYTLTINAASSLTVSPTTLAGATANNAYSATVSATGGSGSYTFSVSAGSLPSWLTLNASTGALAGTPTTSGSASFTLKATDTANTARTGTKAYTLTINAASTLTVGPATLTSATANSAYSTTASATGGSGSYTFSVSAGSLPAWLTLNASTGALTGTPTTSGSASFTLKATDTANSSRTGTTAYTLTVNAASSLTVSPTTLTNATLNNAYSVTASATGGSGSYTYSVSAGSLPSWLTLNAGTGVLSGTPTSAGSASFTIKATDTNNGALTGTKAYTLTVGAANSIVLQSFDSGVPHNGDGDTYPNEYAGSGTATVSLDSTDAVSGSSLKMHLTSGALGAEFNPYNYADSSAYPSRRGFARNYAENSGQWQFNTYDRMSFWIKLPAGYTQLQTDGNQNIEFGTYVKQVTNADSGSDESGGNHYYHMLNVPAVGVWTHVIVNMHPDHRRGDSGDVDPGVTAYPTTAAAGNGGTDPANTYNYFDALTRFYLADYYNTPSGLPVDIRFDNFTFYKEPYQENDAQVSALTATYVAASNRLIVTWNRPKDDNSVKHEVRYSFTDIHQSGWAAATPAPNGILTPPGWQGYNNMVYNTTGIALAGHSMVYIAIKPQNSNLFTQIAIPLSQWLQSSAADFGAGTQSNTAVTNSAGGELRLAAGSQVGTFQSSGTFVSSVFNAGHPVSWGVANWTATLPAGTTLTVQTRTGNTASPDGTWSSWSTATKGGTISSPSGRYIQYQVSLTTSDPTQTATLFDIWFAWN